MSHLHSDIVNISSVLIALVYQHEKKIPPSRYCTVVLMCVLMIHEIIVNPFPCVDGRIPGMWVSTSALVCGHPMVFWIVFRCVGGEKHNVLEPKRNMD